MIVLQPPGNLHLLEELLGDDFEVILHVPAEK